MSFQSYLLGVQSVITQDLVPSSGSRAFLVTAASWQRWTSVQVQDCQASAARCFTAACSYVCRIWSVHTSTASVGDRDTVVSY